MPELPEVETIRRGLADLLPGSVVRKATVFDSPKSFPNEPAQVEQFLYGAKVTAVRRRAKVLIIDLDSKYSLVVHLKMTGQLVFRSPSVKLATSTTKTSHPQAGSSLIDTAGALGSPLTESQSLRSGGFGGGHPTDSLIGELPDRSTRVEIDFSDGSKLFFNDQRKFGWVKLIPTDEIVNLPFFQKVGPEPLDPTTTSQQFIQLIRRRNGARIKSALLDQSVVAGVGNIYADESLWSAKIHPETRVKDLADVDLERLFTEVKAVLQLSIDKGGSTDRNYVDAEGRRGSYLKFANVFRREGQACHRHPDVMIEKMKVGGRGTHICPVCQVKK